MKPLIDLSKAAGETVEKMILSNDEGYLAVHFADGTALIVATNTFGGEPCMFIPEGHTIRPHKDMFELGICSVEEHQEFVARQLREREERAKEIEKQYSSVFGRK